MKRKPILNLQIDSTFDLDQFKQIDGNRIVDNNHVNRLKNSIIQNGMLINPIIVNRRMEVIDGQHRLAAAKLAKSFIYFIVAKNYTLEDVQTLNANQKKWAFNDYLESYAQLGLEDYKQLMDFQKRFPFLTATALLSVASGKRSHNGKNGKTSFKDGNWKFGDVKKAEEVANKILDFEPYFPGWKSQRFIGSLMKMFDHHNYDHSIMLQRLAAQPSAMHECATRDQYIDLMESIYNYRSRNKVSLKY